MRTAAVTNWTPTELIGRAAEQELEPFLVALEAPYVLLVSVPDPSGDLIAGLAAPKRDDSQFLTEMVSPEEHTPRNLQSSSHGVSSTRADALPIAADVLQLRCHVVALPNPSDGPRRTLVGRAPDNDIVLSHRSVSKLHGWLEINGERQLFLGDANSTNHTQVNGTRVTRPVEVHPGCRIRFGSVETFIYRPQSLWQLLHR
jgi:hypothetical protein